MQDFRNFDPQRLERLEARFKGSRSQPPIVIDDDSSQSAGSHSSPAEDNDMQVPLPVLACYGSVSCDYRTTTVSSLEFHSCRGKATFPEYRTIGISECLWEHFFGAPRPRLRQWMHGLPEITDLLFVSLGPCLRDVVLRRIVQTIIKQINLWKKDVEVKAPKKSQISGLCAHRLRPVHF